MKSPKLTIRFDTKAQLERVAKAASARKWSINRFVVESLETAAAEVISEQQARATDGQNRPIAS